MSEDQSAAIVSRIEDLYRCLDRHVTDSSQWRESTDRRLDTMQGELSRNTQVTDEVRNLATTGRIIRRIVVWVGGFAAGIAGLWELWRVTR